MESRHKVNVAEVGRADMLAFKTWLKRQKCSGRSPYNHFLNIAIFSFGLRVKRIVGS